ncbi:MAG: acetate kinase [Oscillospiraceae bacterium]|jgi:acetate kinase
MIILVINAGSSSLKYQLIDMSNEQVIAKGNCERIGIGGKIVHKTHDGRTYSSDCDFPTHTEAFQKVVDVLINSDAAVIKSMKEIYAVGHRIVQGAEIFNSTTLVTDKVIDQIDDLAELAPVHNHAHALALRASKSVLPEGVPQVVVFDTAFHQTMPEKAFMYALPYECYENFHVRKYGFHGTSHRFVSGELARLLNKKPEELKIVSCHLGNGSSICCVHNGKSVDTSMGFTPLDGLIMGTRCGSVDASAVLFVAKKKGFTPSEMSDYLNKQCGFLGVSGISSDNRDITSAAEQGDSHAKLASEILRYQIKKYIGSYTAVMNGLDAVIFTGGIGENAWDLRETVCKNMDYFGIKIDEVKNKEMNGKLCNLTADGARVQTWVVPTNEELLIARDTLDLISK